MQPGACTQENNIRISDAVCNSGTDPSLRVERPGLVETQCFGLNCVPQKGMLESSPTQSWEWDLIWR